MSNNHLIKRLERLAKILESNKADAYITGNPAHIQYFTGFLPDKMNPYLLVAKLNGELKLIAPEGTSINKGEVLEYCSYSAEYYQNTVENARGLLAEVLRHGIGKVGLYINQCQGWVLYEINSHGKEIVDLSTAIDSMMAIKDFVEIELLQKTLELNRKAYDRIRETATAGMTEMELYKEISDAFNHGAEMPVEFIADFVSGSRTIDVAGPPTMRKLQPGDTVIADLLPCREGYYCDTTRTFFVGSPSDEQRKVYNVLLKALDKGIEMLKPGIRGEDVYAKVAGVIADNGYGGCFPHHAGHAIGTGYYEAPYFIKNCPLKLEAGMVVTLEPGIYLNDKFGIRIEDNYLITEDGCVNLFEYPLNIDSFVLNVNGG
jgi:Xaa-Pro aminopeptidase